MNEKLADLLRYLYGLVDYDNVRAAGEVASMTPTPLGDLASGMLAVDDLRKGDYLGAAGNAVGLLPFVPAMGGVIAKHASPYKFDKFSLEHLGSGQGAASYGPGLYFAESPKVLKEYEKEFLAKVKSELGGIENNILTQKRIFDNKSLPVEKRVEAKKLLDKYKKDYEIAKTKLNPTSYEVDIPDSAVSKMLDYDQPLSGFGESKTVKELIEKLYASGMGDREVANYFKEKGITGVKYLDARSRGVGEGTSNFVVFDDEIPKILSSRPIK